jgi:E3 ubiquitin-protein ligase ZSWIM2
MKVWADHQKTKGETQLKCPLCRENFSTFELLDQEYKNNGLFKLEKEDLHYGVTCKACNSSPISGKCYRCTLCADYHLCQACFNTNVHTQHSFVFREKVSQKYRKALRDHVGVIPNAVAISLANRELNEQDYDLLLQLDQAAAAARNNPTASLSQIPEKVIKSWPIEKLRDNSLLLSPGFQCRVCLRPFKVNDTLRKLPSCKHKFHVECIDNWLLHSHPTCPIDGTIAWDPITAQLEKEEK